MGLATLGFLCFCFVLFAGYWLILWLAQEEPEIVIPTVIVALSIFIFHGRECGMIHTWTPDTDTPNPSTGVDYHTVKSWFKQLRTMDDRIDRIQLDIRQAHDKATKCTASMTGMPGGSGHGDKIGLCAEETDENERKMQELQAELEVLRTEAKRRIKYIAGTKSSDMMQACLYGYYVQNQKQVVVARSLGLPNENRVSLYVRDGCKQLAQIWHQFM